MLIIFIAIVATFAIFFIWSSLESFVENIEEKAILITGCDSGFGYDLALKCLSKGAHVFATCFTKEGQISLEKYANEMKQKHGSMTEGVKNKFGALTTVILDVRDQDSIKNAYNVVKENLGVNRGLHALINNAGGAVFVGWDDWMVPEDYEASWALNCLGVIRVTQMFKNLVKYEQGRIITVASVCGRVAIPGFGPYTVSKFAVEGYCDTIRSELLNFGVKVIILEPGFFKTPLTNHARNVEMMKQVWSRADNQIKEQYGEEFFEATCKHLAAGLKQASPHTELVVGAYMHAIGAKFPRSRYQVGYDSQFFFIPFSMLPTKAQNLLVWILWVTCSFPMPQRTGRSIF